MASTPANYTFLPWYRTGLASAIDGGPDGQRGTIEVRLKSRVGETDELSTAKTVHLIGPGDIIGIDARAVVRLDPHPNANDFEPNYLAAIEFFDEDFPWRYSPRPATEAAKTRLLPWLALLVLQEGEFDDMPGAEGLPDTIRVRDAAILPPAGEAWAWAHTHLNVETADPANPVATADLLRRNPERGLSRIIAARRLHPNHSYHAVLVPVFDAGRRAGLPPADGAIGDMAWTAAGIAILPVYYRWKFHTGAAGDFEELAQRLKPVLPDPTVGRRPMDVAEPLPGLATPPIIDALPAQRAVLDLEGALQIPGAVPSPWEAASRTAFGKWLAGFINLAETWTVDGAGHIDGTPELPADTKLPIVLPPSYGRWHANIKTLEPANPDDRWLEAINLDPRNRVAAAFGTLVIQKNQEDFMARAWAQYGELFSANRYRYRAQLMREVLSATEAKHLDPLSNAGLMVATGLTHARVLVKDALTVRGAVVASALPVATVQPTLQRKLRTGGPLARRFGGASTQLHDIVGALATTALRVAPTWVPPVERLSLGATPPAVGIPAEWLGSDWDVLRPLLVEYLERTVRLATRFPPIGAIVPLLRVLLELGDEHAKVSAAGFTPATVTEVREHVRWIPPSLAERDTPLANADRAPSPANDQFSFAAFNFRQALLNTSEWLTQELPPQVARPPLDVSATAAALRARLSPYASVVERVQRLTQLPPVVKIAQYDPLEAIMAYPTFDDATYEYLKKISTDYVVPNLSKIPNNAVALLECNWRFVESFMVGLNHEMSRELLWRGFRTDQRGTYFNKFWDLRGVPGAGKGDIEPIHGWRRGGKLTQLGGNRPEGALIENNLVLVVRGDLLRRYPNTQVYAQRAVRNDVPRAEPFTHVNRKPGGEIRQPVLFARFEPDVYCFGFDLEKLVARGKPAPERNDLGWYFVLAERFGEPRFGLDEAPFPQPDSSKASSLSWANLVHNPQQFDQLGAIDLTRHAPAMPAGGFATDPGRRAAWGTDSADMAALLLQSPFRVFFHANDMLLP
jgi:hypothetical protein